MFAGLLNLLRRAHSYVRQYEHFYMVLLALLIGLGGGLFAVAFRKLIGLGNWVAWRDAAYTLDYIRQLPFWWKLLAPAVGGLICGAIIYYFAREAKGHGVPEVMEAVALRAGRIRPRVVIAKMVASATSIASGGSVGREGPIVQIGSAFGSTVGQWLRLDERRLRTLVACGAAAGIAGTFNAPVAGALFALEIILGDFGVRQFSPIVISSVAATVVGHHFFGDVPAFQVPQYAIQHYFELLAYAALGILAGLVAVVFVRVLYFSEDLFDRLKAWPPAKALIGGVLIGTLALRYPQIFGVGYEAVEQALRGETAWGLLLTLAAVKIVAVSITIGSGGSGGIFAPSLFIGAMLGGAAGGVVHQLWPASTAGPGAYALVGMAAVVGATTHAPLTAIVIIFELTADYKIMLPLMISTISATLLSTRLLHGSIYTIKLLRRGVDIHKGRDISVLRHLAVRDQMRSDVVTVPPGAGLMEVIAQFVRHPGTTIFVTDSDRRLLGVITADQLRTVMASPATFAPLIIAHDMMLERGFPVVRPDDTLAHVMRSLERFRGEVPVVADGRLVGAIWPEDVIERYNAEVFKRDMAAGMASSITRSGRVEPIPAFRATSMLELPVPGEFIGRSLGELDVRSRYNVTVLLVKQRDGAGNELIHAVPSADYVFRPGDVLLLLGPSEMLRRLERGETAVA